MATKQVVEPDADARCEECGGRTEIVKLYMTGWGGDENNMRLLSGLMWQCADSSCPSRE
jgi:hypothetical protein